MEHNKRMVTVTVTEGNEKAAVFTDSNVFIVSNNNGFISSFCTLRDLLEFATLIQAYFFKVIMPRLMVGTKPGITEERIFNDIVEAAKETVNDSFAEVQNESIS